MIKYIAPIATALLLTSGMATAGEIKTHSQAASACKAYIKGNVEGLKRVQLIKVRSSKAKHTVTMSVSKESGRSRTKCIINKADDSVSIAD